MQRTQNEAPKRAPLKQMNLQRGAPECFIIRAHLVNICIFRGVWMIFTGRNPLEITGFWNCAEICPPGLYVGDFVLHGVLLR